MRLYMGVGINKRSQNFSFTVDAIGIGAPRCSTTWLARCIAEHPDVCFSSPKETHFFDKLYIQKEDLSVYEEFFRNCEDGAIKAEFTPSYYIYPDVAQRISELFPETKLIVCLRDPAERAFSLYQYNARRFGRKHTFAEHVKVKEGRMITDGKYYHHLKPFFELFDRSQIYVVLYEDIKTKPQEVIRGIYQFLEVDAHYLPPSLRRTMNPTDKTRYWFPAVNRALKYMQRLQRHGWWRKTTTFAKKLGARALIRGVTRLNKTAPARKKETLTPALRKELIAYYSEDIHNLEHLIGRDLSSWKE